jgi:hypothetical protein
VLHYHRGRSEILTVLFPVVRNLVNAKVMCMFSESIDSADQPAFVRVQTQFICTTTSPSHSLVVSYLLPTTKLHRMSKARRHCIELLCLASPLVNQYDILAARVETLPSPSRYITYRSWCCGGHARRRWFVFNVTARPRAYEREVRQEILHCIWQQSWTTSKRRRFYLNTGPAARF